MHYFKKYTLVLQSHPFLSENLFQGTGQKFILGTNRRHLALTTFSITIPKNFWYHACPVH